MPCTDQLHFMLKKPQSVRLEAAAVCQLKCPACSTGTGANAGVLGRGYLKADRFLSFVEDNPEVKAVELSNYGEIFLNPELPKILQIADAHGIAITAYNGVNLNSAKDEALEAVVKYKVRRMTVSIDGASQATYAQYRIGGNFDNVIRNIETINRYKTSYHHDFPGLKWQFVVFGHNEHELPRAKEMASQLGMDFYAKRSWNEQISPIRDEEFVKTHTGWKFATRSEFQGKTNDVYMPSICDQLWDNPQINWDGRLLGCCVNLWSDFGANVFSEGLEAAFHSEKISYARRMLLGDAPEREDIPCAKCKKFLLMKATGRFHRRTQASGVSIGSAV